MLEDGADEQNDDERIREETEELRQRRYADSRRAASSVVRPRASAAVSATEDLQNTPIAASSPHRPISWPSGERGPAVARRICRLLRSSWISP